MGSERSRVEGVAREELKVERADHRLVVDTELLCWIIYSSRVLKLISARKRLKADE